MELCLDNLHQIVIYNTTLHPFINYVSLRTAASKKNVYVSFLLLDSTLDGACMSHPCLHNATCEDYGSPDYYFCNCPDGYQGANCETNTGTEYTELKQPCFQLLLRVIFTVYGVLLGRVCVFHLGLHAFFPCISHASNEHLESYF